MFALPDLVVTVDGPSGTGKSTVSREAAMRLGLPHLDTGAFYRAATLAALRADADLSDSAAILDALAGSSLRHDDGHTYLGDEDISEIIRGEAVTAHVSEVSAHPEVRTVLVDFQRRWVDDHGGRAVVEGRDIGTVVFPDAILKVYLDASPEVRAIRRSAQTGDDVAAVLVDIQRRDHIDTSREASPLRVPGDSVVVDTSDMTFEQVVDHVVRLVSSVSG